jgi:hypothetical protein
MKKNVDPTFTNECRILRIFDDECVIFYKRKATLSDGFNILGKMVDYLEMRVGR